MILAIFWVLGLAVADGYFRTTLIQRATNVATSGDIPSTKNSQGEATLRHLILPQTSLDSRWWILHAENLKTDKFLSLRVRDTDRDNAPLGREVHWSSSLIWMLSGLSMIFPNLSTEQASLLMGPLLFLISMALLWWGVLRHMEKSPALFVFLGLGTNVTIFHAFRVGEADHHGVVAILGASAVLSMALVLADAFKPTSERRSSRNSKLSPRAQSLLDFSAISLALGIWSSASSTLPLIVGMGLVGLILGLAAPFFGLQQSNPHLWKRWGLIGGATSLGLYLLEYFPFHMGLRLEVNHPVYSMAWAGGGYLVYQAIKSRQNTGLIKSGTEWAFIVLSLTACSVPLILILVAPTTFVVRDAFLVELHNRFIVEFLGLMDALQRSSSIGAYLQVFLWPIVVSFSLAILLFRDRASVRCLLPIFFGFAIAAIYLAMAMLQQRWLVSAMALWIVVAGLLVRQLALFPSLSLRLLSGFLRVAALFSFAYFPMARVVQEATLARAEGRIPKEWLQAILIRDVSHRLVDSRNGKAATILSGPTASTDLAFFGNHKVIGTLYWENLEGLKRAAQMFSAESPDDALKLLISAGVTHIVMPSWDQFSQMYSELLRQNSESAQSGSAGYLDRVLQGQAEAAIWLRPLYYPIPDAFELKGESILIYQILPKQRFGEAMYHRALDALDRNEPGEAYDLAARIPERDQFFKRAEALKSEIRSQFQPRSPNSTNN